MRTVKSFRACVLISAVLSLFCLPLLSADETAAGQTNANTPAAASATNTAAVRSSAPDGPALEKRIRELESEVIKLWNYINATRRMIPGENQIGQIADRQAAVLINRVLGGRSDDATRLPAAAADGGVTLAHIVVGNDGAEEVVCPDGLRVALVVRGPKVSASVGRVFVTIYALPQTDPVLRPDWLIHVDETVPYIDGSAQTHFVWRGEFANGAKAVAGKYSIFVRAIVGESEEKTLGSAMRYWGRAAADGGGNTVLVRE